MKINHTIFGLRFLPDGELLVQTESSLLRFDSSGSEVASRKLPKGCFAVSSEGRLFVADSNKVFEADPRTLKSAKRVTFPAESGSSGALNELVVSPDGAAIAAVTRGGTLLLQRLDGSVSATHPAFGARWEGVGFVSPATVAAVRGNGLALVTPGRPNAEHSGVSSAAAGPGVVLAWALGSDKAQLLRVGDRVKVAAHVKLAVCGATFVPGSELFAVGTDKELCLVDAKSGKVVRKVKAPGNGYLAASADRVAVTTEGGISLFTVPALEPLDMAAAKPKKPAPARSVAPTKAAPSAKPARPSKYRERLEQFVERLRATKGVELDAVELGGSLTEAELATAERKLGHVLPADLRALWADVDGFSISWGKGAGTIGVKSLAQLLSTSSEDVLWNDQIDEQQDGGLPLGKLKTLRVLWSLPGESPAVGIDLSTKHARLFFGEANAVHPLHLTLQGYLEVALATGGRFQDAFAGEAATRTKRETYAATRMVPGWPTPKWSAFAARA